MGQVMFSYKTPTEFWGVYIVKKKTAGENGLLAAIQDGPKVTSEGPLSGVKQSPKSLSAGCQFFDCLSQEARQS